ncbi:hypothetical protein O181_038183 [Austropuccinia psidii MF-1]|uniref:Uncharacterized protein n=1 Tax=Austropuccinia psidii MF-1 TaxID=1389203 RepID=A0A9Q3DAY0_9BASI|nr:hypothetical protein [Austropuccinia psidii MF-1]
MLRQENIETTAKGTSIIPDSTINFYHNSTSIITHNNQPEPISYELISLDISNTLQKAKNLAHRASYNPSRSSQKGYRRDYGISQSVTGGHVSVNEAQTDKLSDSEADDTVLPSNRAETVTRSLSRHIQSQSEGLQPLIPAQRVPDPCRSVEKLHHFLHDYEIISGLFQHWQVTQWMESIDEKEKHDAFDIRLEEKKPTTTQESAKTAPVARSSNSNVKKQQKYQKRAKARHQAQTLTSRATESERFSRMP